MHHSSLCFECISTHPSPSISIHPFMHPFIQPTIHPSIPFGHWLRGTPVSEPRCSKDLMKYSFTIHPVWGLPVCAEKWRKRLLHVVESCRHLMWCLYNDFVNPRSAASIILHFEWLITLSPRQNGRHSADNHFNSAFFTQNNTSWCKYHWNLFLGIPQTINQHWFKQWPGVKQATGGYLNQWWCSLLTHLCITRPWCIRCHGTK